MPKKPFTQSQLLGTVVLLTSVGLLIDIFRGHFQPTPIIIGIILLFLGMRMRKGKGGCVSTLLIIIGVIVLANTVLNSLSFQLLLVVSIAYIGYNIFTHKEKKKKVAPLADDFYEETKEKAHILFEKATKGPKSPSRLIFFIGEKRIGQDIYELENLDINYGIGEVRLDLSTAIIPDGETIITMRGFIGELTIYIPYDVEVSIYQSVKVGEITLFQEKAEGINLVRTMETANYETASRKIKIISTLIIGEVEVKNI